MIPIPALRPTLREKTRYVSFLASSDGQLRRSDVEDALRQQLMLFMGTEQYARAGIQLLNTRFNAGTGEGIIKTERDYVDHVRASLLLTRFVRNTPALFRSVRVSGMMNHLDMTPKEENTNAS